MHACMPISRVSWTPQGGDDGALHCIVHCMCGVAPARLQPSCFFWGARGVQGRGKANRQAVPVSVRTSSAMHACSCGAGHARLLAHTPCWHGFTVHELHVERGRVQGLGQGLGMWGSLGQHVRHAHIPRQRRVERACLPGLRACVRPPLMNISCLTTKIVEAKFENI